jgi:hypothetical protein
MSYRDLETARQRPEQQTKRLRLNELLLAKVCLTVSVCAGARVLHTRCDFFRRVVD